MDSILLVYFSMEKKTKKRCKIIDLGCGAGLIPVLMAVANPNAIIDGVEIRPQAVRMAEENAAINGYESAIKINNNDLRKHREFLNSGIYDLVISNPPYFKTGCGKRSLKPETSTARFEDMCTFSDICAAAAYLTKSGAFTFVHRPERLPELFGTLISHGLQPKRLRFVQQTSDSPPILVLIESRAGAKPSLTVEAPLILKNNDGSDSEEFLQAYHMRPARQEEKCATEYE